MQHFKNGYNQKINSFLSNKLKQALFSSKKECFMLYSSSFARGSYFRPQHFRFEIEIFESNHFIGRPGPPHLNTNGTLLSWSVHSVDPIIEYQILYRFSNDDTWHQFKSIRANKGSLFEIFRLVLSM